MGLRQLRVVGLDFLQDVNTNAPATAKVEVSIRAGRRLGLS